MDGVVLTGELKVRAQDGRNLREIGYILALDGKWHATSTARPGVRKSLVCASLEGAQKLIVDEWLMHKGVR